MEGLSQALGVHNCQGATTTIQNHTETSLVKQQLLAQRAYWKLNPPADDEYIKKLLAEAGLLRLLPHALRHALDVPLLGRPRNVQSYSDVT